MPPDDDKPSDPWAALDKKPEEASASHPVLEGLFHYLMLGICGAVIFAISGGLAVLLSPRRTALTITPEMMWLRFFIGGGLGLTAVIGIYRAKRGRDTI